MNTSNNIWLLYSALELVNKLETINKELPEGILDGSMLNEIKQSLCKEYGIETKEEWAK